MHKQIEDYLAEVAQQFGSLPKQLCDDELKEIHQHLLDSVLAKQELGVSEDVAVANAIAEFGSPTEVGANVLWSWRRLRQKTGLKTFCTIEGIWSALAAFQLMCAAPADEFRWLYFWGFSLVINFLLFIVLPHLPPKAQTRAIEK